MEENCHAFCGHRVRYICRSASLWGGQNIIQLLKTGISGGGYGPGSYYPWIYLQMTILIPILRPVCERLDQRMSLLFFVLLCVIIEIVCSVIDMPESVYRLLCLRYVMLIWFGWTWVKEGVKLNLKTVIISLVSLCSIINLAYFSEDLEPWIYNTKWSTHHWMCYFWVSWLFVGILYWIHTIVIKSETVKRIIEILASASYEIFLVQMAYYALIPKQRLYFIGNEVAMFTVWFALAFIVSITGGVCMYKIENNFFLNKE